MFGGGAAPEVTGHGSAQPRRGQAERDERAVGQFLDRTLTSAAQHLGEAEVPDVALAVGGSWLSEKPGGGAKAGHDFRVPPIPAVLQIVGLSRGVVDQVPEPHPTTPFGQPIDVVRHHLIRIDQTFNPPAAPQACR